MPEEAKQEYVPMTIRVRKDLARRLNHLAVEEDRYLYQVVDDLLRKGFTAKEQQGELRFEGAG